MKPVVMRKVWLAATVGLALAAPAAQAAMIMRLSVDDATWTTITDQAVFADRSATPGQIVFDDGLGVFGTNLTTGTSKPVLGNASAPAMQLISVNIASQGASRLYIELTDTDWSWTDQASPRLQAGGVSGQGDNSIAFSAWYDAGNTEFARTQQLAALGPFGAGAFSGSISGAALTTEMAGSLTLRAVIDMDAFDSILFNSTLEVVPVPEPSTWALAGLALLGLGLASPARRRSAGQSYTSASGSVASSS